MSPSDNPLDRMDQIAACLRCFADLVTPSHDLHTVSREDMAVAMYFLTDEYRQARAALEQQQALDRPRPVRVV